MGATPRVGLKGAPSTPEGALSEPWGEVWGAHQPGPAWSACGSHSRPRGHQAQGAWDLKRWTPSCGNWCPLPRHPPGRVTRKNVTVNGGGSAGGRDTPEALARCGGRGGTRTHVIRGVEEPGPAQLAFAFPKPQSRQPRWASCPRPWQQLATSPQPKPTTPHKAALSSWGSRQGSRSAAGSHGSWRACPARGSGQGCGGPSPAPRESSRVCGPSTTPAGQDRHGDTGCLVRARPLPQLQQSRPGAHGTTAPGPGLREPQGCRRGLSRAVSAPTPCHRHQGRRKRPPSQVP